LAHRTTGDRLQWILVGMISKSSIEYQMKKR